MILELFMQDIHLYNKYHLGDQLYNIHFLSKYVKEFPEFRFFNYMLSEYINESDKHRHPGTEENIINLPLDQCPSTANDHWINRDGLYERWIAGAGQYNYVDFDIFYINFYKYLFETLNLPVPNWTAKDSMFDHPVIMEKFKNLEFDFLFINSESRSGQWPNDPKHFNDMIGILNAEGYDIVTTEKSSHLNIPSTMRDYKLNLLQLGSLMNNCKYIIGKHTAPWLFSFNEGRNNIFSICCHVRGLSYSPNNVYPVRHRYDEIYKILEREGILQKSKF